MVDVTELHRRASVWYEENGLEIEAFHHAAAANDIERAERLIEGEGMPLSTSSGLVPTSVRCPRSASTNNQISDGTTSSRAAVAMATSASMVTDGAAACWIVVCVPSK